MAAIWSVILNLVMGMLGPLMGQVTPVIKNELNDLLTNLYKKALATPSPWDDFFIGMLLDILAIPRPPPS